MRCVPGNLLSGVALSLLLVGVLLSGCARPPWTDGIEGERKGEIEQAFVNWTMSRKLCAAAWDGELSATWYGPVKTASFTASFQALAPSYLKLAVTSPLGLPLMVAAADGARFHYLDAAARTSISGTLSAWAAKNDIPLQLAENWHDWLTGQPGTQPFQITAVRLDGQDRGAWLSLSGPPGDGGVREHILFDDAGERIIEWLVVDREGARLALIGYDEWRQSAGCRRPARVSVTGLPYGARAELLFSDIRAARLTPEDFNLAVPSSFQRIVVP